MFLSRMKSGITMLQKDNKIVLSGFQQILTQTRSEFNQYEDK